jgi:hypothetical protein
MARGGPAEARVNEPVLKFEPWKASFCAGTRVQLGKPSPKELSHKRRRKAIPKNRTVNKARIKRILSQPNGLHKLHQRELPPEPNRHEDLEVRTSPIRQGIQEGRRGSYSTSMDDWQNARRVWRFEINSPSQ